MSPTQTLSTHSPEPSRGNQLSRNLKAKLGIKQILGGEWLVLFCSRRSGCFRRGSFPNPLITLGNKELNSTSCGNTCEKVEVK